MSLLPQPAAVGTTVDTRSRDAQFLCGLLRTQLGEGKANEVANRSCDFPTQTFWTTLLLNLATSDHVEGCPSAPGGQETPIEAMQLSTSPLTCEEWFHAAISGEVMDSGFQQRFRIGSQTCVEPTVLELSVLSGAVRRKSIHYMRAVKKLLEGCCGSLLDYSDCTSTQFSPLHEAIAVGWPQGLKWLLDNCRFDVDFGNFRPSPASLTVVHAIGTAQSNRAALLELLLQAGASYLETTTSPNRNRSVSGRPTSSLSAETDISGPRQIMLCLRRDIFAKDDALLLEAFLSHYAAEWGLSAALNYSVALLVEAIPPRAVRSFLKIKVWSANSLDPLPVTDADFDRLLYKMLLELVRCGPDSELVLQLLDHGAPLDLGCSSASFPHTPLMMAAERNDSTTVELLLRRGAPTETRSVKGSTALHLAAVNNSKDAFKVLVEVGKADVTALDGNGRSAGQLMVE